MPLPPIKCISTVEAFEGIVAGSAGEDVIAAVAGERVVVMQSRSGFRYRVGIGVVPLIESR